MYATKLHRLWFAIAMVVVMVGATACAAVPGEQVVTPQQMQRAQSLNIAIPGRIPDPTNLNIYAPGVSRSNTGIHQIVYEL